MGGDGGPAFPIDYREWPGQTLRDYFAIRFAAALCPHSIADGALTAEQRCSRRAYEYADAMLAERARTTDGAET